jgi:hypothetical protein
VSEMRKLGRAGGDADADVRCMPSLDDLPSFKDMHTSNGHCL